MLDNLDRKIDTVFFEMYQEQIKERCIKSFKFNDDVLVKQELAEEYYNWIMTLGVWSSFVTLTFRDEISGQFALERWYHLVRFLNKRVFGNNYSRFVGHSYFSYCLGIEYQRRNCIHFHVLIDLPFDYSLLHNYWNNVAGFAYITKIEDPVNFVRYVTKYVVKDGDMFLFQNTKYQPPKVYPDFWNKK